MSDNCPKCKKEFGFFRWKYSCEQCGKTFCADCFVALPYIEFLCVDDGIRIKKTSIISRNGKFTCPRCYSSLVRPKVAKYEDALRKSESVEIVSNNYKGKKACYCKDASHIETEWCRDKSDVTRTLQATAAYLGCRFVNKVEYYKDTDSEGNYQFTIWKASGVACNS